MNNLKIVTNGHYWMVRKGWIFHSYASKRSTHVWFSSPDLLHEYCMIDREERALELLEYYKKRGGKFR